VPVPELPAVREGTSVYGFAAVDDRGRLAAAPVAACLGWSPGTRLAARVAAGLVVVNADPAGPVRVTPRGHVRLPATVRHWCGLAPGARVLLVAEPDESRLVIHPAASLDAMISRQHADLLGGDAA
jgi:hypothetical protein